MFWRRRADREQDLERELRAHLELEAEDQREAGLASRDAEFAARRRLGNTARLKETVREAWGWTWLERIGQDTRYGLRMLRKNPSLSVVAVISLALGIGANTAIFGLIDALLFKPLPVRDPQSLFFLGKQWEGHTDDAYYYETYRRLRREQPFFRELAAYADSVRLSVSVDGNAESTMGQMVSGDYYDVLGVPPAAGRLFTPEDDRVPGGHPVAVISYAYWQRRFGGAASAVGKKVLISGSPFTIVGVTPPGFYGLQVGDAPDVDVPVMMQAQVTPQYENRLGRSINVVEWLTIFGRLKPGVTAAQANSGLQVIYRNIQTQLASEIGLSKASWLPEWVGSKPVLLPGAAGLSRLRGQFAGALYVLMGVVGLVLTIACANVANLLLARGAARRREIALRMAIGATRARLVRQLLVESVMLSALGGGLGIGLAYWVGGLLVRFLSIGRPMIQLDLAPDLRVLAFTAAVSIVTGLLFGLMPAFRGAALDLAPALKQGGRGASPPQRFARALSVAQIALSLVVLMGAGLLVRTLRHLDRIDAGFPRDRVYTVSLAPRGSDQKNGPNGPRLNQLYWDLLERVRAIPGVAAASLAGASPVQREYFRPYKTRDGRQFWASQNRIYPWILRQSGIGDRSRPRFRSGGYGRRCAPRHDRQRNACAARVRGRKPAWPPNRMHRANLDGGERKPVRGDRSGSRCTLRNNQVRARKCDVYDLSADSHGTRPDGTDRPRGGGSHRCARASAARGGVDRPVPARVRGAHTGDRCRRGADPRTSAGAALRCLWRAGGFTGGDRALRRRGVFGRETNSGNRRPHGAGRASGTGVARGISRDPAAGGAGNSLRIARGTGGGAAAERIPLRRQAGRSRSAGRERRVSGGDRRAGGIRSGAACFAGRSHARAPR